MLLAKGCESDIVLVLLQEIKALAKEARDAENKATEIENAVYELKAVNPNRKSVIDTRTPDDLLDLIEQKGKEIAEILASLLS